MEVKFKKLRDGVKMPSKATEGSVGYDLYVPQDTIIKKGRQVLPLGFAMEFRAGYEAKIEPRSGYASKGMAGYEVRKGVPLAASGLEKALLSFRDTLLGENPTDEDIEGLQTYFATDESRFNADVLVGKIDADYRGEVGVIINNHGEPFQVKTGQRIAQMTFYEVEDVVFTEAEDLSDSERGDGGYGSSDVH